MKPVGGVADAMATNAAVFASPAVLPKDLDDAATALELAYANRLNGPLAKPAFVLANAHYKEDLHNVIPAGTSITVVVMAYNSAGQSGFSGPVSFTVGG